MDAKTMCNLGLSKLGPTTVTSLDPPKTPMEIKCANFYAHWKRSELTKRRWVFSRSFIKLTRSSEAEATKTADRPYGYSLPENFLRAIRYKSDEWQQRGKYIYSGNSSLVLECHLDVPENNFDPLFIDVFAVRIAIECVKQVTDTRVEKADLTTEYQQACDIAYRNNAFNIGPENIEVEEEDSEWERARFGRGL